MSNLNVSLVEESGTVEDFDVLMFFTLLWSVGKVLVVVNLIVPKLYVLYAF